MSVLSPFGRSPTTDRNFAPAPHKGKFIMVKTASTMISLGTRAPNFSLVNVDGKTISRTDFTGNPLLVVFMCNHCPFVIHIRKALQEFASEYQKRGLAIVGISSNDAVAYPQDGPEKMKDEARAAGYTFPYLFDASQEVAKAYHAACTPDFFLFDKEHGLVYRGQFDSSRPGNGESVTGQDLRAAADSLLAGRPVADEQRASIGCNIKWKAGGEPAYFTGVSAG
jgi:peroxiredoxin